MLMMELHRKVIFPQSSQGKGIALQKYWSKYVVKINGVRTWISFAVNSKKTHIMEYWSLQHIKSKVSHLKNAPKYYNPWIILLTLNGKK